MEKVLFFHSGPGMNSQPERELLTLVFAKHELQLICWDEPSPQRGSLRNVETESAFESYLQSASEFLTEHAKDEKVVVMTHSFSAFLLKEFCTSYANKISRIIALAPSFNMAAIDLNIFKAIREVKDFPYQTELLEILSKYTGDFDENAISGWQLLANYPNLFDIYWENKTLMLPYLQHFSQSYSIDVTSFVGVRKSSPSQLSEFNSTIPTIVCYGKSDRIGDIEGGLAFAKKSFRNLKVVLMEGVGHYPHIEHTEEVLALITKPPIFK